MNLNELYNNLRSGDNDSISNVTRYLMEIYQNPESVLLHFDLLKSTDDLFIKNQTLIALRRILKLHWNYVSTKEVESIVKGDIVTLLTNESSILIRSNILELLSIFFDKDSFAGLECLREEYKTFLLHENPEYKETGMKLFNILLCHNIFGDDFVDELDFIYDVLNLSFETDNKGLILSASNTLFNIASCLEAETISDSFFNILDKEFDVFKSVLVSDDNESAYSLSEDIAGIIKSFKASEDGSYFINVVVSFLQNQDISNERKIFLFDPLVEIIQRYPDVEGSINDFLQMIFFICTHQFINDGADEQQDIYMAMSVFKSVIDLYGINVVIELINPLINNHDSSTLFVVICIFDLIIEADPQFVIKNIDFFMGILFTGVQDSHFAVIENSLTMLSDLIFIFNYALYNYLPNIYESIKRCMLSQNESLILNSLNVLYDICSNIGFSADHISEFFDIINSLTNTNTNIQALCIRCLTSMMFSVGSEGVIVLDNVCNLFIDAAHQQNSTKEILIQSLYGMCALHNKLPNFTEKFLPITFDILTKCFQSQDQDLIIGLLSSISLLAHLDIDILNNLIMKLLNLSFDILQKNIDEMISQESKETLENKKIVADLFLAIIKHKPLIIHDYIDDLLSALVPNIFNNFYGLPYRRCYKLLFNVVVIYQRDPNEIVSNIFSKFREDDEYLPQALKFIRKLLTVDTIKIDPNILSEFCGISLKALMERYSFQKEDYDSDICLKNSALFLSQLTFKHPELFPLKLFIKIIKKLESNGVYATLIIPSLFMNIKNVTNIYRAYLYEFIFDKIKFLDSDTYPYQLEAIISILKTDPNSIMTSLSIYIKNLIEFLMNNDIKCLYKSYIDELIVVIILELVENQLLKISDYKNYIVKVLPVKNNKTATDIYSKILTIFNSSPESLVSVLPQLALGIGQILSLPMENYIQVKLPSEVSRGIVQFYTHICSNYTDLKQYLEQSIVGNDLQRLNNKIQLYS